MNVYRCPITKDLLVDAIKTDPCAHIFSQKLSQEALDHGCCVCATKVNRFILDEEVLKIRADALAILECREEKEAALYTLPVTSLTTPLLDASLEQRNDPITISMVGGNGSQRTMRSWKHDPERAVRINSAFERLRKDIEKYTGKTIPVIDFSFTSGAVTYTTEDNVKHPLKVNILRDLPRNQAFEDLRAAADPKEHDVNGWFDDYGTFVKREVRRLEKLNTTCCFGLFKQGRGLTEQQEKELMHYKREDIKIAKKSSHTHSKKQQNLTGLR